MIIGSVTDPIATHQACRGVDIVLHTAAIAKENGAMADFRAVNVGGTVTLAKAAKANNVKTFVHLSSVMVYGFRYPDQITETGPLRGENNPYCQTKIESEQELWKLNDPPNFGIIIIRPGDVYGPGSLPWVVRPLLLMQQKLFICPDDGRGIMNHVYIDNLIDAIFLAIEQECYGEAFNITDGERTSWKDYFTYLAEIGGFRSPLCLAAHLIKPLIRVRQLGQTIRGQKVDLLPESIDFITRPHAYSIAKAQQQLGYQPKISLSEGMNYTQQWLKQAKLRELIN